jgi:hypothetical protein
MTTLDQLLTFFQNHSLPTDIDPAYRDAPIRACGADDRGFPITSASDVQRYRFLGYSDNPDNVLFFPANQTPAGAPNPNISLARRWLSATTGGGYEDLLTNGTTSPGVVSLCGEGGAIYGVRNEILNHHDMHVTTLLPVDIPLQPDEIITIVSGLRGPTGDAIRLRDEQYAVDRPGQLSLIPEDITLGRIVAGINRDDSPIARSRRPLIVAALNRILNNEQRRMVRDQAAAQQEGLRMQRDMRSDMFWQIMISTGIASAVGLYSVAWASGKAGPINSAITAPFRGLYHLVNATRDRGVGLRQFWEDIKQAFTTEGRHRATLDRMTTNATENARRFQTEYDRAYSSALEESRRTHPGLSDVDRADRARGAARSGLRGEFPDYVAADEMLHSIELGRRSTDPAERAAAQTRLDNIEAAENTLVRDKNSNPVFVDLKGTGKSVSMYAVVLRSIRGESSVPPEAIQRRDWRELSRQGIMGERAEYVSIIDNNVKALRDALVYFRSHGKPVGLIVDEIHSFFGDKATDPHVMKALQIIKGEMAKNNAFGMLGATTPDEWTEVTSDQAMADRLRPIRFPPATPAAMRLAIEARLLTVSPDALDRPDINATIDRLIDSSYHLEGVHSPRRVLDNALPDILSSGDMSVAGVDQYFRNEKQLRINEVVREVVGRFEPMALQARLMGAHEPGASGGQLPDAELRQKVVSAVMEVCRTKGWTALASAEGTRMVTEAFTQSRAVLSSPAATPTPPTPPPGGGSRVILSPSLVGEIEQARNGNAQPAGGTRVISDTTADPARSVPETRLVSDTTTTGGAGAPSGTRVIADTIGTPTPVVAPAGGAASLTSIFTEDTFRDMITSRYPRFLTEDGTAIHSNFQHGVRAMARTAYQRWSADAAAAARDGRPLPVVTVDDHTFPREDYVERILRDTIRFYEAQNDAATADAYRAVERESRERLGEGRGIDSLSDPVRGSGLRAFEVMGR